MHIAISKYCMCVLELIRAYGFLWFKRIDCCCRLFLTQGN